MMMMLDVDDDYDVDDVDGDGWGSLHCNQHSKSRIQEGIFKSFKTNKQTDQQSSFSLDFHTNQVPRV